MDVTYITKNPQTSNISCFSLSGLASELHQAEEKWWKAQRKPYNYFLLQHISIFGVTLFNISLSILRVSLWKFQPTVITKCPHYIINTRNRWHLFITLHMNNRSLYYSKSSHNALQEVLFPRTSLSGKWSSVNEKRSFFTHTCSGHAAICPNDLLMPDISSFITVWILYASCHAGFPHLLTNENPWLFHLFMITGKGLL